MTKRDQREHVRPLTSLRFLAALWVLMHHALPRGPEGSITAALGESGWLGVSLFFVLSGFLLAIRYAPEGVLLRPRRDFWLERVARLAPTYLLAMAFAVPLFVRDAAVEELSAGRIAAVVASALSLQQAWRPELACEWNCPAWSLSVEAWFYLAFPIIILALGPWLMRRPLRGLFVAVASLASSALIFPGLVRIGGDWPLPLFALSPLARWPEFLAGIGLAALLKDWRPRGPLPGAALLTAGLGWLALAVALRGAVAAHDLDLLPIAVPGFMALVAGCWALQGLPAGGLGAAWLVLLGEASYALYLFHAPMHGYVLALTNRLVGRGHDVSWVLFAAYLVLALGSTLLVHLAFERPWRTRLRAQFGLVRAAT